jgi:hypothetical protein
VVVHGIPISNMAPMEIEICLTTKRLRPFLDKPDQDAERHHYAEGKQETGRFGEIGKTEENTCKQSRRESAAAESALECRISGYQEAGDQQIRRRRAESAPVNGHKRRRKNRENVPLEI